MITKKDTSYYRYVGQPDMRTNNSSKVLMDITEGSNNCCAMYSGMSSTLSVSPVCCNEGFSAEVGWDAVSGKLKYYYT